MNTAVSDIPVASEGEVISADLEKVGAALTEYSKVDAGLAELRQTYGAVIYDVKTTAGMDAARKARLAVREPRYRVEEIRKSAKAPLLALGKQIDGEAKRITAALLEIETPIDEQIRAEEARRETERKAKEEAERARVQGILSRIAKLQSLPEVYTSALAPARIAEVIAQIEGGLSADYGEYADQAEALRQAALVALRRAHVDAMEREDRERAAEAERQAKAAQAAKEAAEREAAAKAAREAEEARLRAEREKFEAEQAEARRRQEAEQARMQAERAAEAARVERNEMALQEIQAIQHQLVIAEVGRAPYCKGGDLESIDYAIDGTEKWELTEDRFGALFGAAVKVRETTLERLRQCRSEFIANQEADANLAAQRSELERAAREQAERQAEIERREREAREAEEARKAAVQAEMDRKAAEAARQRAEQERRAELRRQVQSLTAESIVRWIASEFGAEPSDVAGRLAEIPHADWLALTHQEAAA